MPHGSHKDIQGLTRNDTASVGVVLDVSRRSLNPLRPNSPERFAKSSRSCSSDFAGFAHQGRKREDVEITDSVILRQPGLRTESHRRRHRVGLSTDRTSMNCCRPDGTK